MEERAMKTRLLLKSICVLTFAVFVSAADCHDDEGFYGVYVPVFVSGGGYTGGYDESYYESGYYAGYGSSDDCGCYYEDDWRAKKAGRRK